jgi:hypothetical protein
MALWAMADLSTEKQLTFDWTTSELASPDRTGLDSSNVGSTRKAEDTASSSFDAAEIMGNEAAKRQLLVAAASGIPVRLGGRAEYVWEFQRLAGQLGVTVLDDKQYRDFVVEVLEPTRRERECSLPGTSSGEMQKALAEMSEQAPEQVDDGYLAVLEATIRTHHLDRRLTELIESVAQAIARLENAEKLRAAHVAEAINYVLLGAPEPEVPKTPPDAPPVVRPDRQLTFDGLPHWKWPKPKEDSRIITVDRVVSDIDGPPHRFVIQVGDTVEVFSTPNSAELAEVLDVSRKRQTVRVRFLDEKDPIWISAGRIYPAPPGSNKQMGFSEGPVVSVPRTPASGTPTESEGTNKIDCAQPKSDDLQLPSFAVFQNASTALTLPRTAKVSISLPMSLVRPVVDFCQEIAERLSRCPVPTDVQGDATHELKWKLRALSIPFSAVDESGVYGLQWPASRLTADDMKRLRILANLSGLPCNEILCVATRTLFYQTQALMHAATALHEERQIPLVEVLEEISSHGC